MSQDQQERNYDLFLVRLWADEESGFVSAGTWHGKLQHVLSGKTEYFDGWPSLIDLMQQMVPARRKENEEDQSNA